MLLVPGSLALNTVFRGATLPVIGEASPAAATVEPGGLGAVSAIAAARAGATVHLLAVTGDDPAGAQAVKLLGREPLVTTLHCLADVLTGSSATFLDDGGDFLHAWAPAANTLLTRQHVPAPVLEGASTLLCHLDSNQQTTHAVMRDARSRGARTILHLSPIAREPLEWLVAQADVLVMGDHGISELVRQLHPGGLGDFTGAMIHGMPDARLHELCRATVQADVVLHLGSRGAFVSEHRAGGRLIPAPSGTPARGCHCGAACFAGVLAAGIDARQSLRAAVGRALTAVASLHKNGGGVAALPTEAAR